MTSRDEFGALLADELLAEPSGLATLFRVMGAAGLGGWAINPVSGMSWRSPRCAEMFGLITDAPPWTLESFLAHVLPEHRAATERALREASETDAAVPASLEFQIARADGESRWVALVASREVGASGSTLFCFMRDVTERRNIAADVALREAQLRLIYENIQDVVYLVRVEADGFRFVSVNPRFLTATGLTAAQVIGQRVDDVIPEPSINLVLENYARALETGVPVYWEETTVYPAGEKYGDVMVAPIHDAEGRFTMLIGTVHDSTDRREAEDRLHRLAHHDELTALPNRRLIYECLRKAGDGKRRGQALALLYIDLDRFKHVNDTFGHSIGDQLLLQIADRIRGCTRVGDTVGRLGGDEFAIIVDLASGPEVAAQLAQKLIDELQRPFRLAGEEIIVTPSIGIALRPGDSSDPDTLIKFADMAMYHAKSAGRNAYRFYTPEINTWAGERLALQVALRKAIERGEFELYYQPIVDLQTGRWLGAEALLRWHRPGHGMVLPGQFISALEESGLILPVGRWVIEEACRQSRRWSDEGMGDLGMSVNISATQFMAGVRIRDGDAADSGRQLSDNACDEFCEHLGACLRSHGIAPRVLRLELTESVLMARAGRTIALLERLQAMGVDIVVDDFGTGYSSLAYLKRFPINTLKIDREFVDGLPMDDSLAITRAIIRLAHSLNLNVVAEGVETQAQVEALRAEGCNQAQGFHYCRPMPAAEFSARFRTFGSGFLGAVEGAVPG